MDTETFHNATVQYKSSELNIHYEIDTYEKNTSDDFGTVSAYNALYLDTYNETFNHAMVQDKSSELNIHHEIDTYETNTTDDFGIFSAYNALYIDADNETFPNDMVQGKSNELNIHKEMDAYETNTSDDFDIESAYTALYAETKIETFQKALVQNGFNEFNIHDKRDAIYLTEAGNVMIATPVVHTNTMSDNIGLSIPCSYVNRTELGSNESTKVTGDEKQHITNRLIKRTLECLQSGESSRKKCNNHEVDS